jgi:hypothetical protein
MGPRARYAATHAFYSSLRMAGKLFYTFPLNFDMISNSVNLSLGSPEQDPIHKSDTIDTSSGNIVE